MKLPLALLPTLLSALLAIPWISSGCGDAGGAGLDESSVATNPSRRSALREQLREQLGSSYDEPVPGAAAAALPRGDELYQQLCAGCHGRLGDGRGAVSRHLAVGPGDFSDPLAASFFSDRARLEILRNGSPGTTMGAFSELLEEDDLAVVFDRVREFARGPARPQQAPAHLFRGREVFDATVAADFTLTDQRGDSFSLAEQRGRVVLLFFGYIHCPDVCPATLSIWTELERQLGADAADVRFVFITVDPARDSPQRLQQLLAVFGDGIVGLSGSAEDLEAVYEDYDVRREALVIGEGSGGYLMDHSPQTLLIDREGMLRLRYTFGTAAADIAEDVRWLLRW